PFKDYVVFIETRLGELENKCTDALGAGLLDLLAEHRVGDTARCTSIAERIGDHLCSTGSSFLGRDYFDLAIRFHRFNSDTANVQRIGVKKGESLVVEAEASLEKPSQGYLAATHHLA